MTSMKRLYERVQDDLGNGFMHFTKIGESDSSAVFSATRRGDSKEVAVKAIDCRGLFDDTVEILKLFRELKALQSQFKVVVQYESSYLNKAEEILYIVSEKMDCSLADVLDARKTLPEAEARAVFYEVALITAVLHKCQWVHRDRKPANLLLTCPGKFESFVFDAAGCRKCRFKDCDLGLARAMSAPTEKPVLSRQPTILGGTPLYKPPEILCKSIDRVEFSSELVLPAIDVWSNGVILAEMLLEDVFTVSLDAARNEHHSELRAVLSRLPLSDSDREDLQRFLGRRSSGCELVQKTACTNNLYQTLKQKGVSAPCIDLLKKMLCVVPQKRLTAEQVLAHPWLASVRNGAREKEFFKNASQFKFDFDQDSLSGLSPNAMRRKLENLVTRSFQEPPSVHFFKSQFLSSNEDSRDSADMTYFRRLEVGQRVLTEFRNAEGVKHEEGVLLEEMRSKGGWLVTYEGYADPFFVSNAAIHALRGKRTTPSSPGTPASPSRTPKSTKRENGTTAAQSRHVPSSPTSSAAAIALKKLTAVPLPPLSAPGALQTSSPQKTAPASSRSPQKPSPRARVTKGARSTTTATAAARSPKKANAAATSAATATVVGSKCAARARETTTARGAGRGGAKISGTSKSDVGGPVRTIAKKKIDAPKVALEAGMRVKDKYGRPMVLYEPVRGGGWNVKYPGYPNELYYWASEEILQ